MHEETLSMIESIHALGLPVKLDTNGSFPERLTESGADYFAMDIKTAFSRYASVLNENADIEASVDKVKQSIRLILKSGTPHQFRTTMVPGIVGPEDFNEIIPSVKGAYSYLLSGFRPGNTLDTNFSNLEPYDDAVLTGTAAMLEGAGIKVKIAWNKTA